MTIKITHKTGAVFTAPVPFSSKKIKKFQKSLDIVMQL